MRLLVVAIAILLLAGSSSSAARIGRARCLKVVCPGFYGLCLEACEYAFDRSSQRICRRACRVETVRQCRRGECGGERDGDEWFVVR